MRITTSSCAGAHRTLLALVAIVGLAGSIPAGMRAQVRGTRPAPAQPSTAPAESARPAPDRSTPPTPGPPAKLVVPPIETRKLSNGVPVWIVQRHEVPLVQVALVILSGSSADPAGKFGVSSMMAAMLDEGAGTRSSLEIADAIDYLGASLGTFSSYDSSGVGLGVPVARLDQAMPIMADVALRPTFPERELARLTRERLTALLQARDNPNAVASESFPRLLFGDKYRYGVPEVGTPASIASLTVSDLRAFHQAQFRPDRATLLVVGDVQPDSVLTLLESAFGSWTASGSAAAQSSVPAAAEARPDARRVVIVDKPGTAQSEIRIGTVGVARSTEDYFPIVVLNTILGGSFTSRLNQNLREEHGYSYGAGSSFVMRKAPGPFLAGAGVQTDKTSESLTEFFKELNGILQPIPPGEIEKAQNFLTYSLPGDFETNSDLMARLQTLLVYGLPMDYYDTYVDRLRAVTPADVERVAHKYIDPQKLLVVVVGDRKVIEPGIQALKLGPVSAMTIEQVLGPPPQPTSATSGKQ
jgi:predicted Zn-dependent peptidase